MSRFASPAQITGTDPDQLVVAGVYRLTRNPQYTGYVLALAGAALARRSATAGALAAAAAAAFACWVPVEERHLAREFPTSYPAYRARVPRWLGRPRPARTVTTRTRASAERAAGATEGAVTSRLLSGSGCIWYVGTGLP